MTNNYVQEKNIGSLFEFLMSNVLRDKPASPTKYLISLLQERGEALLQDPVPRPVTDPIHCEGRAMEIRRSFDRTLPRSFPSSPLPDLGPSPTPSDFDLQLDLEAKERELALSLDAWSAVLTQTDIGMHSSESSIKGQQSPTTLVVHENDPEVIFEAELINEEKLKTPVEQPENNEQENSAESQNDLPPQSNEKTTGTVTSEHDNETEPQNDCASKDGSQNGKGPTGPTEADMDEELHSVSSKASLGGKPGSVKEHEVPDEPPYTMSVRSCDLSVRSWYEGELYAESCACSIRSAVKEQVSSTLMSVPVKRWTPAVDSDDSGTELYEDDELAEEGLQRSPSSAKNSVKGRTKMSTLESKAQPMKSCRTIFLNAIQDEPTISPEPSPRGLVVAGPEDPFTPRGGWTPLDTQRSDTCSLRRDMSLARILGDDAASLFSEGELTGDEWAYAESVS